MSCQKLVLGTVQFGIAYGINNTFGQIPINEVREILSLANVNGISTLDTSSAYGESEVVLGSSISAGPSFKIISKYPRCDLSVRKSFLDSLYRLNVDRLYGYLVHHFDFYQENPSLFLEMQQLKVEGKIEKVGFSIYNVEQLQYLFYNNVDFDIIQFPYNIFDRQFEPYLPILNDRGIEVHVRSIFLQGLFFKSLNDLSMSLLPLKPYLSLLHRYCEFENIKIEDLALNYVLNNKFVEGVLIGVDNSLQLQNNIDAAKKGIRQQDVDFVNSIRIIETELLNPVNWK